MRYSFVIPQYSHDVTQFSRFAERDDSEVVIICTNNNTHSSNEYRYIDLPGAGYGEAVNAGVHIANGDVIIICNDDVFPDDYFIDNIEDVDIQLPAVYDTEGRLESMGAHLNALGYGVMNSRKRKNPLITGSIFIVKSSIITNHLLDEDYFLYYEDTDLGMILSQHYSIEVNSKLKVYHKHSFSSGAIKRYYLQRNRLLFVTKFRHMIGDIQYLCILAAEPAIMIIQILFNLSLKPLKARVDALKQMRKFNEKAKDIH